MVIKIQLKNKEREMNNKYSHNFYTLNPILTSIYLLIFAFAFSLAYSGFAQFQFSDGEISKPNEFSQVYEGDNSAKIKRNPIFEELTNLKTLETWVGSYKNSKGKKLPIWLTFYENGTCSAYDYEQ